MPSHYLETTLQQAIIADDYNLASLSLQGIRNFPNPQDLNSPSLYFKDSDGNNFLAQALKLKRTKITELLLNVADDIMIADTNNDRISTLTYAVIAKNVNAVMMIISQYDSIKLWLEADANGKTPLHYAVIVLDNAEIVTILINKINGEENAIDLINAPDEDGNSPLHYACKGCYVSSALILIKNGADLTLQNNDDKFPIENNEELLLRIAQAGGLIGVNCPEILRKDINEIAAKEYVLLVGTKIAGELLNLDTDNTVHTDPTKVPHSKAAHYFLNMTNEALLKNAYPDKERVAQEILVRKALQNKILNHCESMLQRNYNDANVKTFYYACVGTTKKLLDVLIHKFENDNALLVYNEACQHLVLPSDLFARMPKFAKKIEDEKDNDEIYTDINLNDGMKPANYQLLNQDRATLKHLLEMIEIYLKDLQSRPRVSLMNKHLAYLVPVFIYAMLIAFAVYCVYKGIRTTPNVSIGYTLAGSLSVGFLVGAVQFHGMAASKFYNYVSKKEITVDPNEWTTVINELHNLLLNPLKKMEADEAARHARHPLRQPIILPTDARYNLRLGTLSHEASHNNTISQTISIAEQFINILKTVQKELNIKRVSFSSELFPAKEKRITILPDENITETSALLPRKTLNGRSGR